MTDSMAAFSRVLAIPALSILSVSCAQPDSAIAARDPDELRFSQDLQRALDLALGMTHGTGISAAVVVPGRGTWTVVCGRSAPSQPITRDMSFNIASIGKNFVAILVCQLVKEGRLSLDDPLSKWLPPYRHIDNAITIIQLRNHTRDL